MANTQPGFVPELHIFLHHDIFLHYLIKQHDVIRLGVDSRFSATTETTSKSRGSRFKKVHRLLSHMRIQDFVTGVGLD